MQVQVNGELETKLTHSASERGRNPDELVQDALIRDFEEEARLVEAVKRGDEGLESEIAVRGPRTGVAYVNLESWRP